MRTTQQFSITLPNEMADIVKPKSQRRICHRKRSDPGRVARFDSCDRAVGKLLLEEVGRA